MQTLLSKHWHHLPLQEVLDLLESDAQKGLDLFEVKHRQEHFGLNVLTPKRGLSPLRRFLLQFNNPLIYILLASAVITAVLKDALDAGVIFGVVLVNAVIGFIQESKAEQALEALAQTMTTEATVVRAGQAQRIPAAQLVPGDLVQIQSGAKVPADLRLIRSRDLQVAEAALTGESLPIQKTADVQLPPETILAERRNMVYASTLVTFGQATGVVIATGDSTEVGRISQLISTAHELQTPLTRKIAQFSRLVLYAILALAAVTFGVGVGRGQPALDTLTAAIALAVAMIPEGLPAALTVTLAIGVSRMAQRRAIIRKLPAVETLGSTTVICSDKTGTLTQNQMTVKEVFAGGTSHEVTGTGYDPAGQILGGDSSAPVAECLRAGLLCNDSALVQTAAGWEIQGDPTEAALIVSARKGGLAEALREQWPRVDAIPFESQHQYMATLHDTKVGTRIIYIKGAAEVVLERCVSMLDSDAQAIPLERQEIDRAVERMAANGLRVLAFARREFPADQASLAHDDLCCDLTFVGLQGMIDPPRPEAVAAVRACQAAGIRVKMITGDHALTAAAIAQQIGLDGVSAEGQVIPALTGQALSQLADRELIDAAGRTNVFARVSPEQKLRLVEALQTHGHVVAMTGDGVNDAPALKQADIGVAMGITGTDVAKEAADMVLTDDNFASIEAAVEEGRTVFDNLTKIIAWTLPTNLGEGLVILAAILTGVVLPILPIHILWINMTTVAALGLVLALEAREPDIMRRPPRDVRAPLLTGALMGRVALVGALILIGAFGLFTLELQLGASLERARTVAVNVVVMVELFYLFNCRSLKQSLFHVGLFSNRWVFVGMAAMLLLQALFTYVPAVNQLFLTAPVSLQDWGLIVAFGFVSYWLVELVKWLQRRKAS